MHGHGGSKTLLNKIYQFLTQVDLYYGHKMVVADAGCN